MMKRACEPPHALHLSRPCLAQQSQSPTTRRRRRRWRRRRRRRSREEPARPHQRAAAAVPSPAAAHRQRPWPRHAPLRAVWSRGEREETQGALIKVGIKVWVVGAQWGGARRWADPAGALREAETYRARGAKREMKGGVGEREPARLALTLLVGGLRSEK